MKINTKKPFYNNAKEAAIALLARREHSRVELKTKLAQRGFLEEEVDQTLNELQEQGLQSDKRFAETYVRWRTSAGLGPRRLALELQKRGVNSELIDQYLQIDNVDHWKEHLNSVWQKKFSSKHPKQAKEHAKQYRFLMQRGFAPDMIHRLLRGQPDENE